MLIKQKTKTQREKIVKRSIKPKCNFLKILKTFIYLSQNHQQQKT